jgi:hypothetical protein
MPRRGQPRMDVVAIHGWNSRARTGQQCIKGKAMHRRDINACKVGTDKHGRGWHFIDETAMHVQVNGIKG